jgi:hypothetical protein
MINKAALLQLCIDSPLWASEMIRKLVEKDENTVSEILKKEILKKIQDEGYNWRDTDTKGKLSELPMSKKT